MLETERLLLRTFCEKDAEDVYAYLKEPAVDCFADMKLSSLEEAREEMRRRAAARDEIRFAIVLKETGRVIGELEALRESTLSGDPKQGDTFSPCWMLNAGFQGRGYAFEAACALFAYLFREKGARRIYAYVADGNFPSQHLCEKLGMRREGLFREFISFVSDDDGNPVYENTVVYAILKKEWDARG